MRYFSFGGGVQSTAALVLAAQGKIDFPVFLFANVGEDSENPDTIAYITQVALPYADRHGIELAELSLVRRTGNTETLLGLIERAEHSIPIPVRLASGAFGNRKCTVDFKVKVIARETKRRGASKANPATIGLGISADEWRRANTNHSIPHQRVEYPLLDMNLTREDCLRIVREAGLPQPPKSSCFFCPYHRPSYWVELRRERPELFSESVRIERLLNERRERLGKDAAYLAGTGPLEVITPDQPSLGLDTDDDACESGYCMV